MSADKDLRPGKLEGLLWDPAKVADSLSSIYAHVVGEAEAAIGWYLKKKRPKQIGAWWLRTGAILAIAVAGVIPVIIQMYTQPGGVAPFPPAWASVGIVVAALLVGFDQFLGCSTGWMRFILTEMRIRRALQVFQLDWETEKSAWRGQQPTDEQIQRALTRAKAFVAEVNAIVEGETSAWAEEFKTALKQIDEAARTKADVTSLGGLNVIVTNGGQCDTGWELSIDGGTPRKCAGTSAAVSGLTATLHAVKVVGLIQGNQKQAEKLVSILAGTAAPVELTLA